MTCQPKSFPSYCDEPIDKREAWIPVILHCIIKKTHVFLLISEELRVVHSKLMHACTSKQQWEPCEIWNSFRKWLLYNSFATERCCNDKSWALCIITCCLVLIKKSQIQFSLCQWNRGDSFTSNKAKQRKKWTKGPDLTRFATLTRMFHYAPESQYQSWR